METGDLYWIFPTAVGFVLMTEEDLTGEGYLELVFGSYSPHNAVSVNNFTDYGQGYLFVLDRAGNLFWRYEHAGLFLRYRFAVLRTSSRREKLIAGIGTSYYGTCGEVLLIEGATGSVRKRLEMPYSFLGLTVFDSDGDGEDEIYTGSTIGKVFHFDSELKIVDEFRGMQQDGMQPTITRDIASNKAIIILGANDIDGDSKIEIFTPEVDHKLIDYSVGGKNLEIHRTDVLVFDQDLRLRKRMTISDERILGSIDSSLLVSSEGFLIGDIT